MTILKAELWTSLSYLLWETQLETPIMCAAGSTFVVQTPPKKNNHITLKPSSLVTLLGLKKFTKRNDSTRKERRNPTGDGDVCFSPNQEGGNPLLVFPQRCFKLLFFPPNLVGQRWWFYPGSELQSSQLDVAASGRWPLGRGVCCCCGAFRGGG